MGQLVLSSGSSKSNKKTKRVSRADDGKAIRREFGEFFEALHDRLIRIEKILRLLPSEKQAMKRIEELTGAKSRSNGRQRARHPYF